VESLKQLLDFTSFVSPAERGAWSTGLLWMHLVSHLLIGLACCINSGILFFVVRTRPIVRYPIVLRVFALFFLIGGLAQFLEACLFWMPMYRLAGVIDALAAFTACAATLVLALVLPRALARRTPAELEAEIRRHRNTEKELAKQAADLQEKNKKYAEAERLKNEFFANVSHELRTPLSLILAPLESMLAGEFGSLNDAQRSGSETIHNNAIRLLQMVTGLLDLARVEAQRVEIKREPVEVTELTRGIMNDFGPIFQHKNLVADLEIDFPDGWALLDRYLYERILFNLLSNAVKFTPAGGKVVVFLQGNGERLTLRVTDTGIGMAAQDLPSLFQKFRQLEGSSTRRFEGSGLGLALVKEFAELMDGSVGVSSSPGEGSTFVVELAASSCTPGGTWAVTPSSARLVQRFSTPVLGEDPDASLASLPRVLIAEDNIEMASYIAGLLRRRYQVRAARNGVVAAQMVHDWKPDLVLADVMMPECDGLSLCRQIKEGLSTRNIPVILLTALIDRDSLLKGWEAGADEYLFKPFHPRELTARVQSMLAGARERMRADAVLREANDALEVRVQERTNELAKLNQELQVEIEQRGQLEKELRKRVEELNEAQRRKDEFLATLGHELRNPLAPIRNSLHIMRMKTSADPQVEAVRDMMERQVVHMTRLVDDLLDVARVSRGEINLRKEPTDLLSMIQSAADTVRPLIKELGHKLVLDLPEDRPLAMEGDPTRLEQIIANLLNNAAKYTPPGGNIELSVHADDGFAEIQVKDNGIGIRPESISHIFELFFQGDRVPGKVHEGLGVGLTLVRNLVEMHGGKVTAHSNGPNLGSQFIVRLPLLTGGTEARPKRPEAGTAAPKGKSLRILAVDDNRDALQSTALLLELCGYEVRQAYNGHQGLEIASTFMPEVVLLDIGLPGGLDGYEVARRLRQLPGLGDILLVALTGYCQAEDRQRSAEAGFNHHLTKPVDPDELQSLLADQALAMSV
jgi:signal transduction histidine kinase